MKFRNRFVLVMGAALALAASIALMACSSSSASSSASSSSESAASSEASSSSSTASTDLDTVEIDLDYNAGTGYEWVLTAEPEGVLQHVSQTTANLAEGEGEDLDGGPLQEVFTFRALTPGEVTLTFNLARSWDDLEDPADTQVYAFTVTDDLEVILNPYKSNFQNEPIIGAAV